MRVAKDRNAVVLCAYPKCSIAIRKQCRDFLVRQFWRFGSRLEYIAFQTIEPTCIVSGPQCAVAWTFGKAVNCAQAGSVGKSKSDKLAILKPKRRFFCTDPDCSVRIFEEGVNRCGSVDVGQEILAFILVDEKQSLGIRADPKTPFTVDESCHRKPVKVPAILANYAARLLSGLKDGRDFARLEADHSLSPGCDDNARRALLC